MPPILLVSAVTLSATTSTPRGGCLPRCAANSLRLAGRHGELLNEWMAAADADDLHRFVTGLRRDYQAVRNGLTLPHSSGSVEGNVNRL